MNQSNSRNQSNKRGGKRPGRRTAAERRAMREMKRRAGAQSGKNKKRARVQSARPPSRGSTGNTDMQSGGQSRGRSIGKWVGRAALLVVFLLIIGGGVFGYKILAAGNTISVTETSVIGQLKDLLFSSGKSLQGEEDQRINMLLIAIGGEGHKGRNLADTIMLASIKPKEEKVALLSIPRDLYVQIPGREAHSKINAVHAFGEQMEEDQGPQLLKQKVEEITNQPIHYYARVDFTAFKRIVNEVGGIDITIDNSFYDYWHKISFPEGTERMDGERALAYVRARYIEGPEGGDFKRAERQQQVLLALKEKVFSVNTAFDFQAVNSILNSLSENIQTDMKLWEMKRFYELARTIDRGDIGSAVLTTGPDGVLEGDTEVLGGAPASILRPKAGDYSEIQAIAENIFTEAQGGPTEDGTPGGNPSPQPSIESTPPPKPELEVRNGTTVAGLAGDTAEELKADGYNVTDVGNAARQDQTNTTVYLLSEEAAAGGRQLAENLGAQTATELPSWARESTAPVLVILGTDQAQ